MLRLALLGPCRAQLRGCRATPGDCCGRALKSFAAAQSDLNINVQLGSGPGQLTLSNTTLGKGGWGRVVAGTYLGQPVAVKLLDRGLLEAVLGQPVAASGDGAGALPSAREPKAMVALALA